MLSVLKCISVCYQCYFYILTKIYMLSLIWTWLKIIHYPTIFSSYPLVLYLINRDFLKYKCNNRPT